MMQKIKKDDDKESQFINGRNKGIVFTLQKSVSDTNIDFSKFDTKLYTRK